MYSARVPKTNANLAIDVLGDMRFQPLLDSAELEKERLVVLEELRMYQDSPQEYVHSLFEQISWPDHPLGRDVGGPRRPSAPCRVMTCCATSKSITCCVTWS